jgi:glycerate kinase
MTILVAPDSFKGTMSAQTVAESLADGCGDAGEQAIQLPLADGGEGTAAVLASALGGETRTVEVRGPLGSPVTASYVMCPQRQLAVVDTAAASGLHLVRPDPQTAEAASTIGTGELVVEAARSGARRILLGVGGSATTDGGIGALQAIRDAGGLGGATLTVLCDVTTPFELAAETYGPQKGANPATVARLTARLHTIAASLRQDPRGVPMSGAAGGLSGTLWAELGAELVPGIDHVLDTVGFDDLLARSRLVITGEGRLDGQTAQGKVIAGVMRRAAARSTPVWAVVGRCDLSPAETASFGLVGVIEAGDPDALRQAAQRVVRTTR